MQKNTAEVLDFARVRRGRGAIVEGLHFKGICVAFTFNQIIAQGGRVGVLPVMAGLMCDGERQEQFLRIRGEARRSKERAAHLDHRDVPKRMAAFIG